MNFTSSLYCTAAAVAAPKKDVVVRALAVVSVSFIVALELLKGYR
jgi:hypothetical protein